MRGPIVITMLAATFLTDCKRAPNSSDNQTQAELSSGSGSASTTPPTAVSSASEHIAPSAAPTPSQLTEPPPDSSATAGGLECAPTVFSRRDTITLRMEHPHGEYLTVVGPDSAMFFLIYPDPTEPLEHLLMSSEAFAATPTIRFPADLRAKPFVYGRDTLEPVFKKSGRYVLTIGHKLETEHASQIHKCTIRFAPPK